MVTYTEYRILPDKRFPIIKLACGSAHVLQNIRGGKDDHINQAVYDPGTDFQKMSLFCDHGFRASLLIVFSQNILIIHLSLYGFRLSQDAPPLSLYPALYTIKFPKSPVYS